MPGCTWSQDVSTHSRSKAAARVLRRVSKGQPVSTHSRSKAAAAINGIHFVPAVVSTHSRSKAAACCRAARNPPGQRFNSQPLEGGCGGCHQSPACGPLFQLTAARRRLRSVVIVITVDKSVSTHSRSKAAASRFGFTPPNLPRFNSQPLEGGCGQMPTQYRRQRRVSTHSRSKAAAAADGSVPPATPGFNSQPLEGGCPTLSTGSGKNAVSTHSRSKAAARCPAHMRRSIYSFNSQPLEGGCRWYGVVLTTARWFQLTAARRRLRG